VKLRLKGTPPLNFFKETASDHQSETRGMTGYLHNQTDNSEKKTTQHKQKRIDSIFVCRVVHV
jgi:hypothetical protein